MYYRYCPQECDSKIIGKAVDKTVMHPKIYNGSYIRKLDNPFKGEEYDTKFGG